MTLFFILILIFLLSLFGYELYSLEIRNYKIKKAFIKVNTCASKAIDSGRYSEARKYLELGKELEKSITYEESIRFENFLSEMSFLIRKYNLHQKSSRFKKPKGKTRSKGYPKNAYNILGIKHPATELDIKKAYRRLSMIHHPDKPTGSEEAFIRLEKCYSVAMKFIKTKK